MIRNVFLAAAAMVAAGCSNVRYAAFPKVADAGSYVETRHKYSLARYMVGTRDVHFADIKESFERNYPGVFASGGIPFAIQETGAYNASSKYGWTFLFPYLLSIGTLPLVQHTEHDCGFIVSLAGAENTPARYEVGFSTDQAFTCYTPFALFCYNGPPDMEYRGFYRTKAYGGSGDRVIVNRKAIAYGAAVMLMELERSGAVEKAAAPAAPPAVPAVPASMAPQDAPAALPPHPAARPGQIAPRAPQGNDPPQVIEVQGISF